MSKVRVYELARELNVESKILLQRLKVSGVKVASHQSTLTDQQVSELRGVFGVPSAEGDVQADGSKPKVILRRRRPSSKEADSEGAIEQEEALSPPPPQVPVIEPEPVKEEEPAEVEEPVVVAPPPVEEVEPEPVKEEEPVELVAKEQEEPVISAVEEIKKPVVEARKPLAEEFVAPPPPVVASTPAAQPSQPATERSSNDALKKRRDVGGATIVRRATPEEVENLESQNRKRQTGRKEDHRGTRVTGLGLLSNRVTADGTPAAQQSGGPGKPSDRPSSPGGGRPPMAAAASGGPATPATEAEEAARRSQFGPRGEQPRRDTPETEEEQVRRRAAAKARRTNIGLTTRALLSQLDPTSPEEDTKTDFQGRTVYTPNSRHKRDVKRRKDLKKTQITTPRAAYRVVNMSESITVGELAKQLALKSADIIKKLMAQGVMATINQEIDFDTAVLIANEYGFEVKSTVTTVEDILKLQVVSEEALASRPPIVTVMGHVDHGKTSILDAIRHAKVAAGEAGGITQHIGAYTVDYNDRQITFLDTPGHEAFSAMRSRGAKVTDIVVLVVAADDGVMPQTVEAISHAKAAGVPLIVAINKIDKPNVNFDRVYTELTEHGVQAEEWGGDIQFVKVSALEKIGLESLLEAILLQSEVLELKASPEGKAEGIVIEAHLDKGRGPVASVVVQKGTLRVGDYMVAGTEIGRVRAMHDHTGREVSEAGPSTPVEIIGLSGVPMAGDQMNAVADERTAREAAGWRVEQTRLAAARKSSAATLQDLLNRVKSEEIPEVTFIVKGDAQGSVEAVSESILKLNTEKVKNRIIHSAVGGVTESDVTLATASGSIIIAFNVRAARGLDEVAERSGVMISYFSIIYDIVDVVKSIMVGKLPPVVSEVVIGRAEVRKPISVPKIGTIAGSAVIDGKITRNAHCRLIRDDIVIYQGKLGSLRRFKDDVKEVQTGYECGIGIDGYNDLKEGDVIEAFVLEETTATL